MEMLSVLIAFVFGGALIGVWHKAYSQDGDEDLRVWMRPRCVGQCHTGSLSV